MNTTSITSIDEAIKNITKYKGLVEESELYLKQTAEDSHTGSKKSGTLVGDRYEIDYSVDEGPTHGVLTSNIGDDLTKKASCQKIYETALKFPSLEEHLPKFFDVTVTIKNPLVSAYSASLQPGSKVKLPGEFVDLLDEVGLDFKRSFSLKRQTIRDIARKVG